MAEKPKIDDDTFEYTNEQGVGIGAYQCISGFGRNVKDAIDEVFEEVPDRDGPEAESKDEIKDRLHYFVDELVRWLRTMNHNLQEARAHLAKLAEFKSYVHKRLDDFGVPADPESSHKAEGCRIGGRLDLVLDELKRLRAAEKFETTP
jgi:hypothetical protein